SGIDELAELAVLDVEDRLAVMVAHVFERGVRVVADCRVDALVRRAQAYVFALLGRHLGLCKLLVRVDMNREQVRDFQNVRQLPEIITNAFLLSEQISHYQLLRLGKGLTETERPGHENTQPAP